MLVRLSLLLLSVVVGQLLTLPFAILLSTVCRLKIASASRSCTEHRRTVTPGELQHELCVERAQQTVWEEEDLAFAEGEHSGTEVVPKN